MTKLLKQDLSEGLSKSFVSNINLVRNGYERLIGGETAESQTIFQSARADLDEILRYASPNDARPIVKKLKMYREITDLLSQIPPEDLAKERELLSALYGFNLSYWINFTEISKGNFGVGIFRQHTRLSGERGKLQSRIESRKSPTSLIKMAELADKYYQLLEIDYEQAGQGHNAGLQATKQISA